MSANSTISSVQTSPEGVLVTMAGMISERSELSAPDVAAGQRVIVDTAAVHHINSLGVRAWIEFVTELCNRTRDVALRNLSPALVLQASMISTFLGCARVESFVTPWICMSCDTEVYQTQNLDQPMPESLQCAACGGVMELDSDPDAYAAFRDG